MDQLVVIVENTTHGAMVEVVHSTRWEYTQGGIKQGLIPSRTHRGFCSKL